MNKKVIFIVGVVICLLAINGAAAKNTDNITSDADVSFDNFQLVDDEPILSQNQLIKTQIEVESTTNFDVVGDYFKVKLLDVNNQPLANSQLTFNVDGKNYKKLTDSNGIASIQLNLKDGSYNILTKFSGSSKYESTSKYTLISIDNTRIIESGMSNSEIQNIINEAKPKNIVLFTGNVYENVELVINKRLTLLSNVDTVLKSSSSKPVITIKGKDSSSTIIKGFNIQSAKGIVISDSDYVVIAKNTINTDSNAIVANNVNYINITKNNIVKNDNGIIITQAGNSYIIDNQISNNKNNGIILASAKNTYIYYNTIQNNDKDGILTTNKIGNTKYNLDVENLFIGKNTINNNANSGISLEYCGNNIKITKNTIDNNYKYGIVLGEVGSNVIQSNVITNNWKNGIRFLNNYIQPKNQDISYNVIYGSERELEARETYYSETGNRLTIGENWYSDYNLVCPKIKTNNLQFKLKQIGENYFTATFYDSKGNIANLLPDRQLTIQVNNGEKITITLSGGTAVFKVNALNGDEVKVTVDNSDRNTNYDASNKNKYVPSQNNIVESPDFPGISYDDLYDMGDNGDGSSTGGNGQSNQKGNSNNGSTSNNKKTTPSTNTNNDISNPLQSFDSSDVSQSVASQSGANGGGYGSKSVVKQITLDEDDFLKITGVSLIILLMILTIGFYYRDDIKEMNSKK